MSWKKVKVSDVKHQMKMKIERIFLKLKPEKKCKNVMSLRRKLTRATNLAASLKCFHLLHCGAEVNNSAISFKASTTLFYLFA
jgi:hypothetical protein